MQIISILNLTPDSFSDGNKFYNKSCNLILERLKYFKEHNSYAIDIGAQSTRPSATILSPHQEMERLNNILPKIINDSHKLGLKVSIDTFYPEIAEYSINKGADIINDVSGLQNIKMQNLYNKYKNTEFIFMHSNTIPSNPNNLIPHTGETLLKYISQFALNTAIKLNSNERLIFDPGIGFGTNTSQSMHILSQISQIRANIKMPVCVGHSRKSFIRETFNIQKTNINELDKRTWLLTNSYLKHCEFIRIHEPKNPIN
jgi:dihydropteroate synthase